MPEFRNLPKVQINRIDGNLQISSTDANPLVLLLGTATKGPGDEAFDARDAATAREVFGQDSELYKGLVECKRAYGAGANIALFRIGTNAATLQIGDLATSREIVKILVRDRTSTVGTDYKAAYDFSAGTLWVWNELGTLVYSNATGFAVDLGEVEVRGDLSLVENALDFGNPATATYAAAATFTDTVTSGTVLTAATTGPANGNLKARYEALQDAYRQLQMTNLDILAPLNVYLDDYNTAYFVSGVPADFDWTDRNNQEVWGSGALGWFKETAPVKGSTTGKYTYEWATDIVLSDATNNNWGTPTERLADEYHEVNFGYQLSNFCYQQTKEQSTCIGVIGLRPPAGSSTADYHAWIGDVPVRNSAGTIIGDGYGMLGFPDIAGSTGAKINPLCGDKSTGRSAGFFATDSEFKDGSIITDKGSVDIDLGAYLSLIGEWPIHLNSFGGLAGYTNSAATYYAGMIGRLDERNAPTNELAPALRITYSAGKSRWDKLTAAHIVMMQERSDGTFVIDAPTFARESSDFRRLTTGRLTGLAENVVRRVGFKYIGSASSAITKAAFVSDIEEELQKLTKRGYLKRYEFSVTTSVLQDILGQAHIKLLLVVPNELRQVITTVALGIQ